MSKIMTSRKSKPPPPSKNCVFENRNRADSGRDCSTNEVVDESGFRWGEKSSESSYKSMYYQGEEYYLHDCVYCYSGRTVDYIGKIMRLYNDDNEKKCRIRWFLRPLELPPHLLWANYEKNSKELFLALGNLRGVENDNLVDVILRKCRVLCTTKHANNPEPSQSDIEVADYHFSKCYEVTKRKIVKIEKAADFLAQKMYNKGEWVTPEDNALLISSTGPKLYKEGERVTPKDSALLTKSQPVETATPAIKELRVEESHWTSPVTHTTSRLVCSLKRSKFSAEAVGLIKGRRGEPYPIETLGTSGSSGGINSPSRISPSPSNTLKSVIREESSLVATSTRTGVINVNRDFSRVTGAFKKVKGKETYSLINTPPPRSSVINLSKDSPTKVRGEKTHSGRTDQKYIVIDDD